MSIQIKAEIIKYTARAFLLRGNGSTHWVPRSVLTDVERTDLPQQTIHQAGLTATVTSWYIKRNPGIKILAVEQDAPRSYDAQVRSSALEMAAALVAAASDDPDMGARFRAWRSAGYLLSLIHISEPTRPY